ncbi:MAG: hypothetical protein COB67_09390 [SAR324 cluster bacterium]|uniref:HTH LytTR-type domain-containing protein n=1 Tax=SAR324 cluster bacterium TaxID=2024889 RepID=A0A2A4T0S7_9DELT|nr:MAG: hypothetical protein COB67_09390 [SAR324 cluster bacterium]
MRFTYIVSSVLFLLSLIYLANISDFTTKVDIVAGEMKVNEQQLSRTLSLNGEWEFYWQKLLEPQEIENLQEKSFSKVPKSWQSDYGSDGFATYRLRISLNSQEKKRYALYLNRIGSSYTLWVNGEEHLSIGRVSNNKQTAIPRRATTIVTFSAIDKIEIVIQVSNYRHLKGGITDSILFGEATTIQKSSGIYKSVDLFGAIFLFLIAFFGVKFYIAEKNGLYLWNSAAFMSGSIYIILSGENLAAVLFPWLPWALYMKILHLSLTGMFLFYSKTIKTWFPEDQNNKLYLSVIYGFTIYSICVLVLPAKDYIRILPFLHAFMLISSLYWFYTAVKAVRNNRTGALFNLWLLIWLMLSMVLEILYINEISVHFRSIPVALTFVGLTHINLLSQHFIDTIREKEKAREKNLDMALEIKEKEQELTESKSTKKRLKALVENPAFAKEVNKIEEKLDKIGYFESKENVVTFYTPGGRRMGKTALPLKRITEFLDKGLKRCSKNSVVNSIYIEKSTEEIGGVFFLWLSDGAKIRIGPTYVEHFDQYLVSE